MILMLAGCQQMDENTVEFETFTADKTVALVSEDEDSPLCKVSLKLQSATKECGHRGDHTVVEHLFHMQEVSVKSAVDRFAEDFTQTYRQTMLPLYNQDRNDTTKRSWYDFHYIISTETQKGSQKTVAYIATVDYYEGGAHGTNQQEIMNFEAKTGRLLTLQDIFIDGSEEELNSITSMMKSNVNSMNRMVLMMPLGDCPPYGRGHTADYPLHGVGKDTEELFPQFYYMTTTIIEKYFPQLSEEQQRQFDALDALYRDWNAKINVISRKDIDNLYEHHVLHSLAIAKVVNFRPGTEILDFGTGGGFPGIPLAIMFPECHFKLIDGTGKKIRVAQEVAQAIGLKKEKGKYDFVVSRAVMPLPDLVKIVRKNISKSQHNALPNGVICLKGGDLQAELRPFYKIVETTDIGTLFEEEWFKQKHVIYLPL